jgi:hypothetical protein
LHAGIERRDAAAILGAVGVAKTEPCRDAPTHDQLAAMARPMVRAAQCHQIVRFVGAAVFARFDMMDVNER